MNVYLKLFWSMFQIGLFSVGGGYVALPLIQHQIVELRGWMSLTEFTDIITIAEMTPGPIAINAATFVGIRVAGIPGALIATLACILPSCCIVLLLAKLYYRYRSLSAMQDILSGLRPAVVGMIASAGLGILLTALLVGGELSFFVQNVRYASLAIFAAGMLALRWRRVNPIYVMAASGVLGLAVYLIWGV